MITSSIYESTLAPLPRTLAIAGAWGYIGRKFLDVAMAHGLTVFVLDPGPLPTDVDARRLIRVESVAEFDRLEVELFHLAIHPEHRRVDRLLEREERLLILNEKPMAAPENPGQCLEVLEAVDRSPSVMLFDFPELFDPLMGSILEYLGRFRQVQLREFLVQRSKDREDPSNPRNYKRMVPIQYQETVHCLAFILHVMAAARGGLHQALAEGASVEGESEPYVAPNPEVYSRVVDGRTNYHGSIGQVRFQGCTDFKRHAEWAKRRIIRGTGDGAPFEIEASFLEGKKALRINGIEQPHDPNSNSYEHVLRTAMSWNRQFPRSELLTGPFPNPRFARVTYQLSSALWRSCRDRTLISFDNLDHLTAWDAGYAQTSDRWEKTEGA